MESKFSMGGLLPSRRLVVTSWREGHRIERIPVDRVDFDTFSRGDVVEVKLQRRTSSAFPGSRTCIIAEMRAASGHIVAMNLPDWCTERLPLPTSLSEDDWRPVHRWILFIAAAFYLLFLFRPREPRARSS